MSGSNQPRGFLRRSPATTKPLKATLPVAFIKKSSPTSSDSPTAILQRFSEGHKVSSNRQSSPDQRISPEWKSALSTSPVLKEKAKFLSSKSGSAQSFVSSALAANSGSLSSAAGHPHIRRTGSLDTLYLATTGNYTSAGSATSSSAIVVTHSPSTLAASTSSSNPRDAAAQHISLYGGYCGRLMVDRATQTPEEWEEQDRKKGQQRKSSDVLDMKYIRQRLHRSTQMSRVSSQLQSSAATSSTRGPSPPQPSPVAAPPFSPVQQGTLFGSASSSTPFYPVSISTSASLTAPPLAHATATSSPSIYHHFFPGHSGPPLLAQHINYGQAGGHATTQAKAAPIPIPHIPKPLIPRMRNSVEGLNQEIEKLVLRGIAGNDAEGDPERAREPTPDGHQAPIAKLFRTNNSKGGSGISSNATASSTVDTQTPTSRSQSISPTVLIIPGSMDGSRPPSSDGRKSASPEYSDPSEDCKFGASPQINKFLAREPPDGCEKIKLIEEPHQMCPLVVEPCKAQGSTSINSGSGAGTILLRPRVNFVLMPSQSSAFHSPCLPPTALPSSALAHTAEGIPGNVSALLGTLGANRGSAPNTPPSRSPLNERMPQ